MILNDLVSKRKELWYKHHNIVEDTLFTNAIIDRMLEENQILGDENQANSFGKNCIEGVRAPAHTHAGTSASTQADTQAGTQARGGGYATQPGERDPCITNPYIQILQKPELLIELFMVIVDKDRHTVPFFLNDVQKEFINILNRNIADFKRGKKNSLKFLILKGRQQGFTSVVTAYQLACTISQRNFTGMTIADNSENSFSIFEDKAKYPYSNLPDTLKPTEKFNNRMELNFEKLNSKWRIATAGNKEVGRSKTINFFHASESAFFESIDNILTGLGQALTKDSIVVLESTANGFNEFEKIWSEAEKGDNNFIPLFFEWWRTPEYFSIFESEDIKISFLNSIENQNSWIYERLYFLKNVHKLNDEQLYWYFNKFKDIKNKIKQEYPCSPQEAFLTSGKCIFDVEALMQRKEQIKREQIHFDRGNLKLVYEEKEEKVIFVPDVNGYIKIYNHPKTSNPYCIGADVAEGKENGDYDAAQVIDNLTLRQVAVWHGKLDVDNYATELYKLGIYYNAALLAPEKNFNPGTIINLEKMCYPKLYIRQKLTDFNKNILQEFGWHTNRITRPIIIADLVEYIRDYLFLIVDIETIEELITFVNLDGKPQALPGKNDDLVLSLAIAIKSSEQGDHTLKEEPIKFGKLPKDYVEDYQRANPAQRKYLEIKWKLKK